MSKSKVASVQEHETVHSLQAIQPSHTSIAQLMRYRVTIPTEHPIKASNRSKSRFSGPLSLPKYPNQSQSEVILDQFRRSIENCSKKYFSFSFSRDDLLTSSYTLISANDEMSSPSEDRSPHYKLAWGILAGIIPLTLVKLIYIKKYHR